jgi:hypothetical protein
MSTLGLRTSRSPRFVILSRDHHDIGETASEYIGTLPDESAEELDNGGSIRIRLREYAGPNEAPWILEVVRDGRTLPGTLLSDERLAILTAEPDRIRVDIDGAELSHRKRALMRARAALTGAEELVRSLGAEMVSMDQEIREKTANDGSGYLRTADEKWSIRWWPYPEPPSFCGPGLRRWQDLDADCFPVLLAEELLDTRARIREAGGDPIPSRGDMLRRLKSGETPVLDIPDEIELSKFALNPKGSANIGAIIGKMTLTLSYELSWARAALAQLVPAQTAEPTGQEETGLSGLREQVNDPEDPEP